MIQPTFEIQQNHDKWSINENFSVQDEIELELPICFKEHETEMIGPA